MTAMVLVAATGAGVCVVLLTRPDPPALLRARLGAGRRPSPELPFPRPDGLRSVARRWPLAVAAAVVVLALLRPSALLLWACGAGVTVGVLWLHAGARRRRSADRTRRQTIECCDALVAELRAGQPSVSALSRAAEQHPLLLPAARAAALGAEVAPVLDEIGALPGAAGMRAVAAAWRVAVGSGGGLVAVLERVAAALRTEESTRIEVAAALSPARATARMLAVLPAFGLLLGSGLGGDPLGFLLSSMVGHLLLLAGVTLALAGTAWVERLAHRVQP